VSIRVPRKHSALCFRFWSLRFRRVAHGAAVARKQSRTKPHRLPCCLRARAIISCLNSTSISPTYFDESVGPIRSASADTPNGRIHSFECTAEPCSPSAPARRLHLGVARFKRRFNCVSLDQDACSTSAFGGNAGDYHITLAFDYGHGRHGLLLDLRWTVGNNLQLFLTGAVYSFTPTFNLTAVSSRPHPRTLKTAKRLVFKDRFSRLIPQQAASLSQPLMANLVRPVQRQHRISERCDFFRAYRGHGSGYDLIIQAMVAAARAFR